MENFRILSRKIQKIKSMKTHFKNSTKSFLPISLMLITMYLLGVGCNTSKPTPDPLVGWRFIHSNQVPKTIADDYQDYIQKLPPKERSYVQGYDLRFFEDGTGQHAVKIEIAF